MTRRDPATDPTARDAPDGRSRTRSGDGLSRTQRTPQHAIRRRAIPAATGRTAHDPATGHSRRDGPYGTRSGDGPFPPRRAVRHAIRRWTRRYATIISCLEMSGNVRKCPEYVWLFVVMSDYPVCSARCVGMRAAQRSASGAPLADMEIGTADGTERTFVIATIHGPRQWRHLHAAVGRRVDTFRKHRLL